MAIIVAYGPDFSRDCSHFMKNHHKLNRTPDWIMRMNPRSSQRKNREEFSIELQRFYIPSIKYKFDRMQHSEQVSFQENKMEFDEFVVREAVLDEEFRTAAWLRAETHWEDRTSDKYVDNYKRKFIEQEFNAIKRRHKAQIGPKCTCIVTVKKEYVNTSHTATESIVGTVDLSNGILIHGANFPGERVKATLFGIMNTNGPRYGYISNLCVAQSARRKGIASKMLNFAINLAKLNAVERPNFHLAFCDSHMTNSICFSNASWSSGQLWNTKITLGAEQVFVHVHSNNKPAQNLYQKLGFEVVKLASPKLSSEQTHMLRLTL